jgi:hypothetical protein
VALNVEWHSAVFARQTNTRGGLNETEEKELAVKPHDFPSLSTVVAMITPLGKMLIALVNDVISTIGSSIWE